MFMKRCIASCAVLVPALLLASCSGEAGPALSAPEAADRAAAGKLTIIDIRSP